ncbi:MAG: hypothetical protein HYZ49_09010 [Chloroflexi bacterium]|nr:hypothetical protein [Chloroflexota bacterium]
MRKWILCFALLLTACGLGSDPTPYLVTLTPAPTQRVAVTVGATDTIVAPTATPAPTTAPTQIPDTQAPAPPTPVPPTPEPTQDPWPPELAAPGNSKMGIHVLFSDDSRIMEFIRRVKPRVVKAVDNHGWLAEVKQISPQTITIGRYSNVPNRDVLDGKDPSQYPNPADFARDFINLYLGEYLSNPGVDYWEGWNEFPPSTPDQWKWYAAFEAERACQMQALGLKAAIGGFSAGKPEYPDIAYFIPAIEAVQRCGGILTLHEYSSPVMQYGVDGGIPNAIHVEDAGALTLRYRYWYEGYLKPRGLVVPLVISEAGIDGGAGAGCPLSQGGHGWYSCIGDWQAMDQYRDMAAWQIYMSQLSWYDSELRQDDYVLGFTVFTAGTSNNPDWRTFDINDMLVPMAVYMAGQ